MRFLPQPGDHREGMVQGNRGPGPKEGSVITGSPSSAFAEGETEWQSLGFKRIPQALTQMQNVEKVQGSISQGPLKK